MKDEQSENSSFVLSSSLIPLPSSLLILLLFVGSGCAALIYEVVWLQMLQLVVGSSAVSLGILLAVFMGGMCLGSLLLPRCVPARWHPLRVYAALELGIGLSGICVLHGIPMVGSLYIRTVGHGMGGFLLRGVVAGICLLPPTLLMGATLPAIARWVRATPRGMAWLGFFYGGNIAGAVIGCLTAGFYLLRLFDMPTATYVAVAINFVVASIAFAMAMLTSQLQPGPDPAPLADHSQKGRTIVYLAIALSGMTALSAEVVWTRLLSVIFGARVYTFSIILAVFLIGLGFGSGLGAAIARLPRINPRLALGMCQMLLIAGIGWTAHELADSMPYWPAVPDMTSRVWSLFFVELLRCAWAILPATILWGASFPLALAAAGGQDNQDAGRVVGGVYAANTLGAIIGAALTSLALIAWIGTQHSQQLMIALAAVSAVILFGSVIVSSTTPQARGTAATCAAMTFALAGVLAVSFGPVPGLSIAFGRYLSHRQLTARDGKLVDNEATVMYVGEGLNSSVAVTYLTSGVRCFHVAGRIEATSDVTDMRVQRLLGHVPALLHGNPRSVLVVGCGAGVTAGSFLTHPSVQRIVICEIEPLIPQVVAKHFGAQNYNVVQGIGGGVRSHVINGKQVEVVYDDARHFILTTPEKFDVVTSDPIHPWVKGSATLYTREYFQLCAKRLKPGGVVTQWVPLYESTPAVVKSELATFFSVFPRGTIWANDIEGQGYDVVLVGRPEEAKLDVDEFISRFSRPEYRAAAESLAEVRYGSALEVLAAYAGRGPDLAAWLSDAEVNNDRDLRLQYLAGMGLNTYQATGIYQQILSNRRFPEDLFVGSNEAMQILRQVLQPRRVNQ